MAVQYERFPIRLELRNAFNLSNGSSDSRTNLFVRLFDAQCQGYGEAPIVPYYGYTADQLAPELDLAVSLLSALPETRSLDEELVVVQTQAARLSPPARCAIDLALHDRASKKRGKPLHDFFNLSPRVPDTSFTIAIDAPEAMAERARKAKLPILKIKLGVPQDVQIVRAIREATSAKLRLDVNGGWSRDQALERIPQLMELDIELIEQPLAKEDVDGYAWLRSRVKAPIFADESIQSEDDVLKLRPSIDGVVVKLMKSGGLAGARKLIALARKHELQVMISCMIESSLAVTAAAHLGASADYIDLDGPLLIANDPFEGLRYHGARIELPTAPGIGAVRRAG